ncbi:histone deacetylase, putative [Plasmodium ovale curtisi]|uniref:Histone deacetylase, putative n=1 Tax=Plasmodium ovale curtisi TaxID=864141 RepID=A0A1A8WJQ0_PLAOA|nr:histone deacetylase, putative [Plasmodium ovale curtisi]SBS93178.1 histone deacetylase, putative [Plasmodium ovale curtisi]
MLSRGLLYLEAKKVHIRLACKNMHKDKETNLVDFYIEKFLHPSDVNSSELHRKRDHFHKGSDSSLRGFLHVQDEIRKKEESSFRKEKYAKIFPCQKKFSLYSKNPPYVFHPTYSDVDMKEEHRFKVKKYENIFTHLIMECVYDRNYIIPSCDISKVRNCLFSVHEKSFVDRMLQVIQKKEIIQMFELDLFSDMICRFLVEINGTVLSSLLALKYFMSMHVGGGNHHSKINRGDGFCIFNDTAIAINFLLLHKIIDNAIILDVDVHQGDGTAEIFQNCQNVKTISIHCRKNYPLFKKKSTIDIELDPYIQDEEYLEIYKHVLTNIKPDKKTILFYLAGVDISQDDDLGLLLISDDGIYQRDYMTYRTAAENNLPVVTLLAGGYNECEDTLTRKHLLTFR